MIPVLANPPLAPRTPDAAMSRETTLRFVRWAIWVAVSQGIVLALLGRFLPGFTVGGPASVVVAAVLIVAGQAVTWPLIYWLAARFHPLLFPVFSLTLSGLLILLLSDLVTRVGVVAIHAANIWTGIAVALSLTLGSTLFGALFSLHDDAGYDWFVTRPLRRTDAGTSSSSVPGILFLEIDGLAEPILRRAIADGWMPTLARWLATGSHRLSGWEPDLSSQTSASQAGILLGDNTGIPAFRWYDKASGKLMVSSRMATARSLEDRLSRGTGLLADGGGSRWNVFSGDAADCLVTYSTFGNRARTGSASYLAYFVNPYTLPRALGLFVADVFRERWQAWRQVRRDERPRVHRSRLYALVRAATATLMQEAALFMLISDVFRGVPSVYTTFFAYDEVAHHSGIDRTDAFKVLRKLDHLFATLERAVGQASRPYHLVVLSDHGQSMGATFRQQYGQTLDELVRELMHPDARLIADLSSTEHWANLELALNEAVRQGGERRSSRLLRRTLHGRTDDDDVIRVRPTDLDHDRVLDAAGRSDVVVLASGSLGLISFPQWPDRLTYEQLTERYPGLLTGLLQHRGIGFIMVHSEAEGGLAIGAKGIHFLDHDTAEGVDPLLAYGPNAARHLRRTDGFANAPDILVMSRYDPETDAVAAFEELVGSHGGLGGSQDQPFVLHPTRPSILALTQSSARRRSTPPSNVGAHPAEASTRETAWRPRGPARLTADALRGLLVSRCVAERVIRGEIMEAFDIAIIGGGISGTAAAYELAKTGARVILLERGDLASMASGWTLAGVRQSGRHPAELPLAQHAVRRWERLAEELGVDVEYRQEGNLRLARTEDEVATIQALVDDQRGAGLDVTFLPDNAAVREIAPALAESIVAASWCPSDGHANPTATVRAFAAAAERHGATIRTGTTVEEIIVASGRVRGVRTEDEAITADTVILAAGVYSDRLLEALGIDLPLTIRHVSAVQSVPLPPMLGPVLGTAKAEFAGRQQADGRLRFTGGIRPWTGKEAGTFADAVQPPADAVASTIQRGIEIIPSLATTPIARVWGGLIDMSPDALPVIDRSGEIEGLIVAAGFSGHGFCLGPTTGQLLCELATRGESSLPLDAFRLNRFTSADAAVTELHG